MQPVRASSLADIARYRVVPHPSSRAQGPFVHLVEHEGPVRTETMRVLAAAGHDVRGYSSATEFLAHLPAPQLGCVLLAFSLPDADGLNLQAELAPLADLPIILTSRADSVRSRIARCAVAALVANARRSQP